MTVDDLAGTDLWEVVLPMLSRHRHTPLDLLSAQELLTHLGVESAPADEAGCQGEEAVVDVGAAFSASG